MGGWGTPWTTFLSYSVKVCIYISGVTPSLTRRGRGRRYSFYLERYSSSNCYLEWIQHLSFYTLQRTTKPILMVQDWKTEKKIWPRLNKNWKLETGSYSRPNIQKCDLELTRTSRNGTKKVSDILSPSVEGAPGFICHVFTECLKISAECPKRVPKF